MSASWNRASGLCRLERAIPTDPLIVTARSPTVTGSAIQAADPLGDGRHRGQLVDVLGQHDELVAPETPDTVPGPDGLESARPATVLSN